MRQLDGEAKKASANILKSLYESAASVKKQINTDKPEEAPKEEKEALIKKVQKPEVPHKEHIVEAVEGTESTESLRDKIAELQAYLDDTPEVPEDERASIQSQIDEILDEINYNENSLTEEVQVFDDEVSLDTVEDIYSVNEGIFAVINTALSELETEDMDEDKKSKLVDKLNTLKAENDKMRTLLNGYMNTLEESSLNEAPNPENEEANKKIRDVMVKGPDSKFYQDVLNMGYNVEKDRYNKNSYIIVNPKKDAYRGNHTGKGSTLSAYPDGDKNRGKRAISREGIKKMKADKRNAIDYKNALDKDYSPRSTGERLKFGSGKAPGTHYSNQFINDNVHSENTYDNYAQDTNLKYPNSGTEKIREFRRAKENTKIYEDPKYNYMYYRDMYRDAGDYNVNPKSYYDDKVKRAKEDLKDFQDSIADRILKLQSYIDDAKSERDKARKNYNNEKKKIKKLLKKESEELTEARNSENDEANELIRTALNDPEYAKNHSTELRKHGIKYLKPEKGYDSGALEGKQGRRLAINTNADWRKDDIRHITDTSYSPYISSYADGYSQENRDKDYEDLRQKTYAKSREDYNRARKNIDRQRTRVRNLENKDQFDSKVLKARDTLQNYEDTLKKGISADYKDTYKIHPDTDLKGFLNAKRHSDRPLAREDDPEFRKDSFSYRYNKPDKIIDPSNRDLEDYKWAKRRRQYLDKERERIDQSNQEDQDRIKEMKKRFADDKARREKGFRSQEKYWKDVDSRIQNKLDNYRQKMSKK